MKLSVSKFKLPIITKSQLYFYGLIVFVLILITVLIILLLFLYTNFFKYKNKNENEKSSNVNVNISNGDNQSLDYVGGGSAPKPPLTNVNMPTRGEALPYTQIGTLSNNNNTVIPLYGRQTYPGSNQWNYYISNSSDGVQIMRLGISHDGRDCMKEHPGCKEIMDGDTITIPQYNDEFTFKRYNNSQFRYIP